MSQDLLRDAREQADRFPPPVRSAALCHIARVLTKSDPAEARRMLEEGLALAASLRGEAREILLGEGAVLAAAIAPARAFEILAGLGDHGSRMQQQALVRMVDHGFEDAAAAYLADAPLDFEYAFGSVVHAIGRSDDDELKRRVLRGAIAAFRRRTTGGDSALHRRHFANLFTMYWELLPRDEARTIVHELVDWILSVPDSPANARFGASSGDVVFTSTHQYQLFEILDPLQHLDPGFAASIIPQYRELSQAAWRFPYGDRSIREQLPRAEPAPPPPPSTRDYWLDIDCVALGRHVSMRDAIRTEFSDAFAAAMDRYDDDTDPEDFNEVPMQCWPSAAAFRTILYKAGEYEGAAAARHLERIPDPALKLFAQIELTAALAGLPQLGSTTMHRGARARRRQEDLQKKMKASGDAFDASIPPGMHELPPAHKPDLPPSRDLRVSPATAPLADGVSGGSGRDFVEIRSATLRGVVSHLFEMPPTRIVWDAPVDPDARYDFVLVLGDEVPDEERRRLVGDGIARHFGVRLSVEDRPRPVRVVTAPNGVKVRERRTREAAGFGSIGVSSSHAKGHPLPEALRLQQIFHAECGFDPDSSVDRMDVAMARALASMTGAGASIDGVHGEFTIGELCSMLEPGLDRPLINETGQRGRYVIAFECDEPGGFLRAVMDRLGLVLSDAERIVPVLVVSTHHPG